VSALEDASDMPPVDEPPAGWYGEPAVYWRRRFEVVARDHGKLMRLLDESVAVLHEHGLHAEADSIEARYAPF